MNTLSIVMPAHNEAGCIEPVVGQWLAILDTIPGKMVVVNDGSRDDTGAILDRLARADSRLIVVHQTNQGHGPAVLRAYREGLGLRTDFIFQTDSDDQFTAEDFWKLWELRDRSRFITGFRQVRQDAPARKVMSWTLTKLLLIVYQARLKDANIPFRLMRADFLAGLIAVIPPDTFAPNIFLALLATKAGQNLFEVPIRHVERKTGVNHIIKWRLVTVSLKCTRQLLAFRGVLSRARRSEETTGREAA